MHRIRAPFNVTTAGQAAAVAAIADTQWVDESRAHNRKWREWLAGEVEAMGNHGLKAVPSRANFLLRSEEHTSELQSLMRISYAVFCLKKHTCLNHNKQT